MSKADHLEKSCKEYSRKRPGEPPATAVDCYGFVLANLSVDICMMGAKHLEQMKENLEILECAPMTEEELNRMRRIGDYIHGKRVK